MCIAEDGRAQGCREPGREPGREVEPVMVVGQVSLVRVVDSARRREVERPLRKD